MGDRRASSMRCKRTVKCSRPRGFAVRSCLFANGSCADPTGTVEMIKIIFENLDMAPSQAPMDMPNRALRDVKGFCNLVYADKALQRENFLNGTLGKLRFFVLRSAKKFRSMLLTVVTPLAETVSCVFGRCAQKQMIGVYAASVIAMMADIFVGYFSGAYVVEVLVGKAMRKALEVVAMKTAVTPSPDASEPQPASGVRFGNVAVIEYIDGVPSAHHRSSALRFAQR